MARRRVLGVDLDKIPYVCFKKDPRKTPLTQCRSLGDMMATIQRCKELDEKDKKKKRK